jgi:DNA polymerase/3'-5' exonuclease PolX
MNIAERKALKKCRQDIDTKIQHRLCRITLNIGQDAVSDLDKLDSVASTCLESLHALNGMGAYEEVDAWEELVSSLEQMKEAIEETQRTIEERGFLEDDADETEVQDFIEDEGLGTIEELAADIAA